MLKREITYTDLNDQKQTETLYFNLTKSEWIELVVDDTDGLDAKMRSAITAQDALGVLTEIKGLILAAYGIKSEDGKSFRKKDPVTGRPLADDFVETMAFDQLFVEVSSSDEASGDFFLGLVPAELRGDITKENLKSKTAEALGAIKRGEALPDLRPTTPTADPTTAPQLDTSTTPPTDAGTPS